MCTCAFTRRRRRQTRVAGEFVGNITVRVFTLEAATRGKQTARRISQIARAHDPITRCNERLRGDLSRRHRRAVSQVLIKLFLKRNYVYRHIHSRQCLTRRAVSSRILRARGIAARIVVLARSRKV